MEVRVLVNDEQGISPKSVPIPHEAVSVTIVDGDREVTYDPESYEVTLTKDASSVEDFSDDAIPVDA